MFFWFYGSTNLDFLYSNPEFQHTRFSRKLVKASSVWSDLKKQFKGYFEIVFAGQTTASFVLLPSIVITQIIKK